MQCKGPVINLAVNLDKIKTTRTVFCHGCDVVAKIKISDTHNFEKKEDSLHVIIFLV